MNYFRQLAAEGARFPIGTHLELAREADPAAAAVNGRQLGRVIEQTARRWNTPVAIPLMDLAVEKEWLGIGLGLADAAGNWHFEDGIPGSVPEAPLTPRLAANNEAIRYIASETGLLPCGMCIGPFSLLTKLLTDPITPVFMAGIGEDDEDVARLEALVPLCVEMVERTVRAQVGAGARALIVCEPAANTVYFSPNQLEAGADTFERFVMQPNRRVAKVLADLGADLILHDCGELTDAMVRDLASLQPAVLSLGSSRCLWHDAGLIPDDVVLYGNLPSKQFYSDESMPVGRVEEMARELVARMRETGHPYILGSECDVLHVAGAEQAINAKVEALMAV